MLMNKDPQNYTLEPKYQDWLKTLKSHGCTINAISPISLLYKHNGEFLFGLFNLDGAGSDGAPLLRYALVRGHACVIVPRIKNRDTGESRFVMVIQNRVGNGAPSLEFPAGMLDTAINDPVSVALNELYEEAGISISAEALVPLWDKPLYTSIGLHDEALFIYGCDLIVDSKEFESFKGKFCGNQEEGESLTVVLKTAQEAEVEATSAQVILALNLFERALNLRLFSPE